MRATGIVREIDENRRVAIPKELARAIGFPDKNGVVEFFTAYDPDLDSQLLILVPYKMKPKCSEEMLDFMNICNGLYHDLDVSMCDVENPDKNILNCVAVIKEYIENNYNC